MNERRCYNVAFDLAEEQAQRMGFYRFLGPDVRDEEILFNRYEETMEHPRKLDRASRRDLEEAILARAAEDVASTCGLSGPYRIQVGLQYIRVTGT